MTSVVDPSRNGLATVKEMAAYLGVSRSKVYQLMDQGELPYVKLGRSRRIRWLDAEALVLRSLVGAS